MGSNCEVFQIGGDALNVLPVPSSNVEVAPWGPV